MLGFARLRFLSEGAGRFQRLSCYTIGGIGLLILGFLGIAASWWREGRGQAEPEFLDRFRGGTLFIAGGGELPPEVQRKFWKLAGERSGQLVIVPAYAATHRDVDRLKAEWKGWPFRSIEVLQANSREEAFDPRFSLPIQQASAVWLSGGEQGWLAQLYAETPVERQLQGLLDRGGVIGGTSAGASIMTRVMIEEGSKQAKLNRGLDLLKDSVVDQHFFHRNRPQRLMGAVRNQPHLIGFGVDEGTALVVQVPCGRLGVIGKSYVMACIHGDEAASPRLEILKPGDDIDLNYLRQRDELASEEVTL